MYSQILHLRKVRDGHKAAWNQLPIIWREDQKALPHVCLSRQDCHRKGDLCVWKVEEAALQERAVGENLQQTLEFGFDKLEPGLLMKSFRSGDEQSPGLWPYELL